MKRPAVFFDRDNTLIVNDGYLGDSSKVVLMDGAADAVARARALGYATVTFSNQSGVARGMFEEEDVQRVNTRMDALLIADNPEARFDRHEFCPFHPDGIIDVYKRETDRRKPGPGMILSAAEKLALDLERSWVVGDALRDVQAGRAAGCRTILFRPQGVSASPEAESGTDAEVQPDFTVDSLKEALDVIEKNRELPEKEQVSEQAATSPEPSESAVETAAAAAAAPVADTPAAAPVADAPAPDAPVADAPKPEKPWLIAAQAARARRAALAAGTAAPAPTVAPVAAPVEPAPAAPVTNAPAPALDATPWSTSEPAGPPIPAPAAPDAAPVAPDPEAPAAPKPLDYRSPGSHPVTPPDRQSRPIEPLPDSTRLETLAQQILEELRRRHEHDHTDFSVTKLLAGVVQMIALAAMFMAYVRGQGSNLQIYLLVGIFLQCLTIALLIMTRQK